MGKQLLAYDTIFEEIVIITVGHHYVMVEFETGGAMLTTRSYFLECKVLGEV